MVRIGLAALCAMLMGATQLHAATVKFAGSLTSYAVIGGVADPLALGLPETFVATLETAGASITSGQLTFTSGSGKFFVLGAAGTIVVGGATTDFNGINILGPSGGTLAFSIAKSIATTSDADLASLLTFGGGPTIVGGFAGGNAGVYTGAVTVVPEPSSMIALSALVLGAGGYRFRKRAKKADIV